MQKYAEILANNVVSILDALPDGVFISDANGVSLHINRTYEVLTGLKQEQIEGKNVRALVKDGVFDCILNPEVVQTGHRITRLQRLKNGKRLVLTGFPVFDQFGTLCLVITFARDVTRLAQVQEQVDAQSKLIAQINDQLAYMSKDNRLEHEPVFVSDAIGKVVQRLKRFAETDATVLLLGETGSGKEVFARYTHELSARRERILLKIDCGSIADSLIESEFFGYVQGAYTGASTKGKAGYFEIANKGTIFLDEIGELSLPMQTRLLRVLQDGEIMRVGSSSVRKVDVRVIAATNRNLSEEVKMGRFRSDLFYRLHVATVHIPPLRERPEDVPVLAEHYLRQYTSKYRKKMAFMDVTIDIMRSYAWPGNVRELQNLIHSLVITVNGSLISPQDLPSHISGVHDTIPSYTEDILKGKRPLKAIVAEMERAFLLKAIEFHGSVQKVADLFGVNRSTIFRKLKLLHPASGEEKQE